MTWDVIMADRVTCVVCGHECDLGDCGFDDEGEPRCPVCGGRTE